MVSPRVRLLGLLVPVLVIPLGLLALKALGIVAIFMSQEPKKCAIPRLP